MARGAWYAYAGLLWIFLAALVVQIFVAGLGLFADATQMQLHRDIGWTLHLPVVLIGVAALVARVGRPTIWWVLVLFVSGAIQPLLPGFRLDVPILAALHPLNAVVLTVVTLKLALDTLPALRAARAG